MALAKTTRSLLEAYCDFPAASIPEDVWAHQRNLFDDVKTVALMGAHLTENQALAKRMAMTGRSDAGMAVHWASNRRVSRENAAYLNGIDAAALDFDPVHAEAVMHADIVVLPALLAIAHSVDVSGDRMRSAHIIGSEFACRLSLASSRKTDWFESAIFGVFGAVLACGVVLKWPPSKIESAMGLALGMCSGTKAVAYQSVSAKRLLSAHAARSAVEAIMLTEAGFRGPRDPLFGSAGLSLMFDSLRYDTIKPPRGTDYAFAKIEVKQYPACLMCHEPIRCAVALRAKLGPDDIRRIARIEVTLPEPAIRTATAVARPEGNLVSVSAMFSIPYAIACAILYGRFSISDILDSAVAEPSVCALMSLVHVHRCAHPISDYLPVALSVEVEGGRSVSVSSERPRAFDAEEPRIGDVLAWKRAQLNSIQSGRTQLPKLIGCAT